jgi:hypothetical protein
MILEVKLVTNGLMVTVKDKSIIKLHLWVGDRIHT